MIRHRLYKHPAEKHHSCDKEMNRPKQRFSPELLRLIRNQVKIAPLLAVVLRLPFKTSEGHLRFLCPLCTNFHTAVNPKTNLGRCFSCRKNFNPIDMVMVVQNLSFVEAVRFLEKHFNGNPGAKQNPADASSNQTGGVRIKETARGKFYCVISRGGNLSERQGALTSS